MWNNVTNTTMPTLYVYVGTIKNDLGGSYNWSPDIKTRVSDEWKILRKSETTEYLNTDFLFFCFSLTLLSRNKISHRTGRYTYFFTRYTVFLLFSCKIFHSALTLVSISGLQFDTASQNFVSDDSNFTWGCHWINKIFPNLIFTFYLYPMTLDCTKRRLFSSNWRTGRNLISKCLLEFVLGLHVGGIA